MTTRDLADATSVWDTAVWDDSDEGVFPYGSTWASDAQTTDLAVLILEDPDTSQGVAVGPSVGAGLRFVVQALSPAASDSVWDTTPGWDTISWSSVLGTWVDISSYVRGVTWQQGTATPDGRAVVGTATMTLANRDGVASPWATTGFFAGAGSRSWMRAGLLVRFGFISTSASPAGLPTLPTFSAVFTGKVYGTQEGTSDNTDAWVDVSLEETTVDLGITPDDQATHSYRYLSDTLYEAMMASGWQYQTDLVVPAEDVKTIDSTLSGLSSMERLQLIADGLHWDVMADGRGRLFAVQRRTPTGGDSGLSFSNSPTGSELPLTQDVQPFSSSERIINQVQAASVSGALMGADDTDSEAQFGLITNRYGFPRNDLIIGADSDVSALCERVVTLRAWDDLGIDTIAIDTDMDPANLPVALAYLASVGRTNVSVNVRWVHPSLNVFTEVVIIEAQKHSLYMEGKQLKWTATLTCAHAGAVSGS